MIALVLIGLQTAVAGCLAVFMQQVVQRLPGDIIQLMEQLAQIAAAADAVIQVGNFSLLYGLVVALDCMRAFP